jgi:hypothetical protein
MFNEIFERTSLKEAWRKLEGSLKEAWRKLEGSLKEAWRKLEGGLKDYCPRTIVKEETNREYRVLAQDFSLYLNNTLYLYLNMVQYIIFEYFILNIIYII